MLNYRELIPQLEREGRISEAIKALEKMVCDNFADSAFKYFHLGVLNYAAGFLYRSWYFFHIMEERGFIAAYPQAMDWLVKIEKKLQF